MVAVVDSEVMAVAIMAVTNTSMSNSSINERINKYIAIQNFLQVEGELKRYIWSINREKS